MQRDHMADLSSKGLDLIRHRHSFHAIVGELIAQRPDAQERPSRWVRMLPLRQAPAEDVMTVRIHGLTAFVNLVRQRLAILRLLRWMGGSLTRNGSPQNQALSFTTYAIQLNQTVMETGN